MKKILFLLAVLLVVGCDMTPKPYTTEEGIKKTSLEMLQNIDSSQVFYEGGLYLYSRG